MRPALHFRHLHARLQNREPGHPLPIPSTPVLSPAITPIVGNGKSKHANQPAPPPALQPPPPTSPQPSSPPQQPPISSPSPSNPHKGGNGNGNGGNHGNSGNGNSGNDGGGGPPPSASEGPNNQNPGSSLQIQPSLSSSSDSAISSSPSGTSIASGSNGSSNLVSSKAAEVSSTGAVFVLNNEAMPTSASSGTPNDAIDASAGVTEAFSPSITSGSSLDSPGSSPGSSGSPSAGNGNNGNGTDSGTGSPGTNNAFSASHSQLSAGAIVGIIVAIFIILGFLAFYIMRKRYLHRKAERRVRWVNGVNGESSDMQETQRCLSMRSSWGTPVEHRLSDPFRYSMGNSGLNTQEGTNDAHFPYSYNFGDVAPVLPMPVHSPIDDCSYTIKNPFADRNSSPQPIKHMSSLPIRVSLISEGSFSADPFDDAQGRYFVDDHILETGIASGETFAHGSGVNRDSGHGTQANFPLPPPSASSATTVFAIGSLSQLLEPPGILISFPDSPISPTFSPTGTSSYPRRASVKLSFHPSQDRRDVVHVEKGDQINVVSVYEDGWAFIQNERTSERGLVPLDCLEIDNI